MINNIDINSNYDIEYLCKLFFEAFSLPVHFLTVDDDLLYSFFFGFQLNPLTLNKTSFFNSLISNSVADELPHIITTSFDENYLKISMHLELNFNGSFIIGPSLDTVPSSSHINDLIKRNKIPSSLSSSFIRYFNSLTILDNRKLLNYGLLVHYFLYKNKINQRDFIIQEATSNSMTSKVKYFYDETLIKNRQNTSLHHSPNREEHIMECIKRGDSDNLIDNINLPMDGDIGLLAKNNPIRAEKNLAICSITMATRAAIKGGLDSEIAYTLSDSYIQAIEEITDLKEINSFMISVLMDFTNKVNQARKNKYSKVIATCINYIFKHIYENITLDLLCNEVKLSHSYVSALFKKEIGIPISEYIQKEKIEEAKKLLSNSNCSILDISIWLNFHDQSHFTRVFKQFTGTTPKKYRENINRI